MLNVVTVLHARADSVMSSSSLSSPELFGTFFRWRTVHTIALCCLLSAMQVNA